MNTFIDIKTKLRLILFGRPRQYTEALKYHYFEINTIIKTLINNQAIVTYCDLIECPLFAVRKRRMKRQNSSTSFIHN